MCRACARANAARAHSHAKACGSYSSARARRLLLLLKALSPFSLYLCMRVRGRLRTCAQADEYEGLRRPARWRTRVVCGVVSQEGKAAAEKAAERAALVAPVDGDGDFVDRAEATHARLLELGGSLGDAV
eukprot:945725-Pleurochrysis_carterae.AAC.1